MKGFLSYTMLILIAIFGVLLLLPMIATELFPILKYLLMGYFAISIFLFVRGIIGNPVISFVIMAALFYIFIIRMWAFFTAGYMFYLLISFGLTGIIIFSIPHGIGAAKRGAY